jgi:hypothetical protein
VIIFPVACQAGARIPSGVEDGDAVASGFALGTLLGVIVADVVAPDVALASKLGVADDDAAPQPPTASSRLAAASTPRNRWVILVR